MKLVYPEWEKQIIWSEQSIPIIVLENPVYHFKVLEELHQQINGMDGHFVLSEGVQILDMKKQADLISSPWELDCGNHKIAAKLLTLLKSEAMGETYYGKTRQVTEAVLQYAEELSQSVSLPLSYDLDLDPMILLKAINIHIDLNELSFPEKIISYMDVCTELFGPMCFIFNMFREFLSHEQLQKFYRTALDKKLSFLFIEGRCNDKIKEEDVFTIDNDLCQLF